MECWAWAELVGKTKLGGYFKNHSLFHLTGPLEIEAAGPVRAPVSPTGVSHRTNQWFGIGQ